MLDMGVTPRSQLDREVWRSYAPPRNLPPPPESWQSKIQNLKIDMRDSKALTEYMRRRAPLTSVVSYPNRGPWGDNRYPGNCSGYLLIDLCATFQPRAVLDPMEGGGTSRDVCADMGIAYQGFDLHSGVDSLHDEIGS